MLEQYYFEKMKKSLITMIQNLCTIDYQLKTIQNQLQRSPATNSQQNRLFFTHMLDICQTIARSNLAKVSTVAVANEAEDN